MTHARASAEELWAGTVSNRPGIKTGAHHQGGFESSIYVQRGKAHVRSGDELEFVADPGSRDLICIPPYVPHPEVDVSPDVHKKGGRRGRAWALRTAT